MSVLLIGDFVVRARAIAASLFPAHPPHPARRSWLTRVVPALARSADLLPVMYVLCRVQPWRELTLAPTQNYKRAVYRPPPKEFNVEVLTPTRMGARARDLLPRPLG